MARPVKSGLDYFFHDTDAATDRKVAALRMLYGAEGYTWWFILLENIYREPNVELDVSDAETTRILAGFIGVAESTFETILASALRIGMLDRDAYEHRKVLTSDSIKRRAAPILSKRRNPPENTENKGKDFRGVSDGKTTQKPDRKPRTRARREQSRAEQSKYTPSNPPRGELLAQARQLYEVYPRKSKPRTAECAIANAIVREGARDGGGFEYLLDRTRGYANATSGWPEDDRLYIPHPASWFNAASYDEPSASWLRLKRNGVVPAAQRILTPTEARVRAQHAGIQNWQAHFDLLFDSAGMPHYRDPSARGLPPPEGYTTERP